MTKPDLHSAMLMVKPTNKRCWDCYLLDKDQFGGGSLVVWGVKWVSGRRNLLSGKTISKHYIDDVLTGILSGVCWNVDKNANLIK